MERQGDEAVMVKREEVYRRLFGEDQHVWHEKTPEDPHIDIYCFKPDQGDRGFFTLVSGGMSDRRMGVPPDAPTELFPRRTELVFYCEEPRTGYAKLLNRVAHYPFDRKTWLGQGHTMDTGDVSLLEDPGMHSLLFIPAPLMPDRSLPEALQIDGDPVGVLWIVPITARECRLAREEGIDPLIELFDKHQHPFVFEPGRVSYV
jgi:hypothetical protein